MSFVVPVLSDLSYIEKSFPIEELPVEAPRLQSSFDDTVVTFFIFDLSKQKQMYPFRSFQVKRSTA
jgi:hypothetical protein